MRLAGSAEATDARRHLMITGVTLVVIAALVGPSLLLFRGGQGSAAFGDSHALGANHLGAATLDIEIGEQSTRLSAEAMAPGDTIFGLIDIANRGDVSLLYSIVADNGDDLLMDRLVWDVWAGRSCNVIPATGNRLVESRVLGQGSSRPVLGNALVGLDPGDRTLEAGEVERICMAVTLPQDAPDELQGRSVTQDIHVLAEHHQDGTGA